MLEHECIIIQYLKSKIKYNLKLKKHFFHSGWLLQAVPLLTLHPLSLSSGERLKSTHLVHRGSLRNCKQEWMTSVSGGARPRGEWFEAPVLHGQGSPFTWNTVSNVLSRYRQDKRARQERGTDEVATEMSWWLLWWDWGRGNEKRYLKRGDQWDQCGEEGGVRCVARTLSWCLRNLSFWLSTLREGGHHYLVQGIGGKQFGVGEEINSVLLSWRDGWALWVEISGEQWAVCVWSSLERPGLLTPLQCS